MTDTTTPEDHRIERAMLFARRQAMRDVLAMVNRLQQGGDWAAGFSVFRDWVEQRESVQSRALEQARTEGGRVPDELRERPIEADAAAMIDSIRGVGGSVVVEHEGKRAIFMVAGWKRSPTSVGDWRLILQPQVDP
jgi:hypothetical protein